jgi:hypothetical protein
MSSWLRVGSDDWRSAHQHTWCHGPRRDRRISSNPATACGQKFAAPNFRVAPKPIPCGARLAPRHCWRKLGRRSELRRNRERRQIATTMAHVGTQMADASGCTLSLDRRRLKTQQPASLHTQIRRLVLPGLEALSPQFDRELGEVSITQETLRRSARKSGESGTDAPPAPPRRSGRA